MLDLALAFAVGVYVGKAHYDQFVALVKKLWAKIKGLFTKTPPTA